MLIRFKKIFYRHKSLTILAILLVFVCLFYITLSLTTYIDINLPNNVVNNSFSSAKTLVYVQKSKTEQIDNTIMYYQNILENNNKYSVDGFEINIFLSKDNKIVVSSFENLNEISDCKNPPFNEENIIIGTKTIGELKQYNIGYNLSVNGTYPYRNIDANLTYARIITLDELLNYLKAENQIWKKTFKLIITVGDKDKEATISALNDVLTIYNYANFCTIVSKCNVLAKIIAKYPNLNRTATQGEIITFFHNAALNISNPSVKYSLIYTDSWQNIHLSKNRYVSYANYCGVPIIFNNANTVSKINSYAKLSPDGIAGCLPNEIFLATIK